MQKSQGQRAKSNVAHPHTSPRQAFDPIQSRCANFVGGKLAARDDGLYCRSAGRRTSKPTMRNIAHFADRFWLGLFVFLLALSSVANAADVNPLRPPDTSSPRATLHGFVDDIDITYPG
jgi:hypothetical protein